MNLSTYTYNDYYIVQWIFTYCKYIKNTKDWNEIFIIHLHKFTIYALKSYTEYTLITMIQQLYISQIEWKTRGPSRPNYPSNFVWTVLQLLLVNKGLFGWPIGRRKESMDYR